MPSEYNQSFNMYESEKEGKKRRKGEREREVKMDDIQEMRFRSAL